VPGLLLSLWLYMRAEVVERRQAVLSRLVQLRADGRLSGEVVQSYTQKLWMRVKKKAAYLPG